MDSSTLEINVFRSRFLLVDNDVNLLQLIVFLLSLHYYSDNKKAS